MSERNDGPPGVTGSRQDAIGLALIGLVGALTLFLAAAIALPAWADINAPATATPPVPTLRVAGVAGAGSDPVATPERTPPAVAATTRPRPTATEAPDEEAEPSAEDTPTPTPEIDATLRPAPPIVPDDGSGESFVVESGPTYRQEIALTFDAGDDRGDTEAILDLLAEREVIASFGVTGEWAEANPDLIERMVVEGHMLINHTWSHQSFTGQSTGTDDPGTDVRLEEIERTEAIIEELVGYDMRPFFRPPYGDLGPRTLVDIATAGYGVTVMWSVDSLGWQEGATADEVVERVLDGAAPGGIVLFHVSEGFADYPALPEILDGLAEDDYTLVTVEQLLRP